MINSNNEFEEINFKALTGGLGFNEKKPNVNQTKQLHFINTPKPTKIQSDAKFSFPIENPGLNIESRPVESISLNSLTDQKILEEKNIRLSKKFTIPSLNIRIAAWFVDFSIILFFYSLAIIISLLSSGFELIQDREIFLSTDFISFVIPVFVLFYVFYFSILEKTEHSTIGKRIFSLKVLNIKNEHPSIIQTLLRSIIFCISPFTFGLLLVIDAPSKLTDTIVIKELER